MELGGSFGALWRRKGLTLALLILTLLSVVGAWVILPWRYTASSTETLLNSQQSSEALGDGNPYLSFDSAMVDMANFLAMKLTNDANTQALQQNGYIASFQAQVLSDGSGNEEPFIQISVSGSSRETVAQTLQGVTASLSTLLMQVQAGVPADDRLSLQTIAETAPAHSMSAKVKPIVGLLAVGLILTFLIPQAIEGTTRQRKIRAESSMAVNDRSARRDLGGNPESDRYRPSHAEARSDDFQQQWPDQQVSMRQKGGIQSRTEYGAPSPSDGRYPRVERHRLCSTRNVQRN